MTNSPSIFQIFSDSLPYISLFQDHYNRDFKRKRTYEYFQEPPITSEVTQPVSISLLQFPPRQANLTFSPRPFLWLQNNHISRDSFPYHGFFLMYLNHISSSKLPPSQHSLSASILTSSLISLLYLIQILYDLFPVPFTTAHILNSSLQEPSVPVTAITATVVTSCGVTLPHTTLLPYQLSLTITLFE